MAIIRSWEYGPYVYHITRESDNDTSYTRIEDEGPEYAEENRARGEEFRVGVWEYLTIGCEIYIKTDQYWAHPNLIGRAYLHGIESDSDDDYFAQMEEEMIEQAEQDLIRTREALMSAMLTHPVPHNERNRTNVNNGAMAV